MRNYVLLLILFLSIFSCTDCEDDAIIEVNQEDIDLVTGLDIRQDEFSEVIRLGNPNILQGQSIVFPNPAVNYLNIKTNNSLNLSSVWIVDGYQRKIYQDINFDTTLNSNLYSEDFLNANARLDFLDNSSSNLQINLENLTEGYYRVFVKINDAIEWHNIYKGDITIQELIDYWDN
ncbi:hypothetical protein [Olleya namhaensis]|uniref:hypothetical protein n=1 Tax=Olleya namhaensis TaxID=1144750 RepID=UPI0023303694|nr:hypothetical protein [Olleya namhaensis]